MLPNDIKQATPMRQATPQGVEIFAPTGPSEEETLSMPTAYMVATTPSAPEKLI